MGLVCGLGRGRSSALPSSESLRVTCCSEGSQASVGRFHAQQRHCHLRGARSPSRMAQSRPLLSLASSCPRSREAPRSGGDYRRLRDRGRSVEFAPSRSMRIQASWLSEPLPLAQSGSSGSPAG